MDRNKLLRNLTRENKDPITILVSTWHPRVNVIPSILNNNSHLISNNPELSKIFKQKPTITYRKKSLPDYLLNNIIANQQLHFIIFCNPKFCLQVNTAKPITKDKLNITEKNKRYWKLQGKRSYLR